MSPSREQPRSAEREMKCGSVLRGLVRPSPRMGVAEDAAGHYTLHGDRTWPLRFIDYLRVGHQGGENIRFFFFLKLQDG